MLGLFFVVMGWGLSLGAVIGDSTIEPSTYSSFSGRGFASVDSGAITGAIYTAVSGDAVDTLAWYGGWGTDGTNLTINIGIYTVTGTPIDTPITLVDSTSLTVTSGTLQWWKTPINIPLVAGTKYCIAWVARSSHSYDAKRSSCQDCTAQDILSGAALQGTWTMFSGLNSVRFSVYANVSNTPATPAVKRIPGIRR